MSDYSTLTKNFWELSITESLNASSILMYLYILHKLSNAEGNEATISDTEMVKKLSLTRPSLSNSRRILLDNDLINYSFKKGKATQYSLVTSFSNLENKSKKSILPNQSDNLEQSPQSTLIKKGNKLIIPGENNAEKRAKKKKEDKALSIEPELLEPISPIKLNENIPEWSVFLEYSQSLPEFEIELESKIREKYDNWVKNNWTNSLGRPITDWKTVLKKAMPFIKNNESSLASKIPNIQRPKI